MIQTDIEGPVIIKMRPALGGVDNAGIGETQFGERFLLKLDPSACLAEFVGAAVCRAVGIPATEPCVVQFDGQAVFGSRLESGVTQVTNIPELINVLARCDNPNAFSAVLAVDLALGNPDRHWANWLYQERSDGSSVMLRAVDFSRSWPVSHPPLHVNALKGENTYQAWCLWPTLGIQLDQASATGVCNGLQRLDDKWLSNVFNQLPLEWKIACDAPFLCEWWKTGWTDRVTETMGFVAAGAWQ